MKLLNIIYILIGSILLVYYFLFFRLMTSLIDFLPFLLGIGFLAFGFGLIKLNKYSNLSLIIFIGANVLDEITNRIVPIFFPDRYELNDLTAKIFAPFIFYFYSVSIYLSLVLLIFAFIKSLRNR